MLSCFVLTSVDVILACFDLSFYIVDACCVDLFCIGLARFGCIRSALIVLG